VVSFTPLPLYSGERAPPTNWIGGWVGPRAGLDDVEKTKFLTLPELELRPLGRPARSQSLSSTRVSNILLTTAHCKLRYSDFRYSRVLLLKCLLPSRLILCRLTHLFRLDPVTAAIWLVSFDLIILSILRRTTAYSSSIHNNLDSLWLKEQYHTSDLIVFRTSYR
jgi:hypothetical protein